MIDYLIPRSIMPSMEKQIKAGNIVILTGARQTGKTSILKMIIDSLRRKSDSKNIFYFDLEKPELLEIFDSHNSCLRHLQLQGADLAKTVYLFIDEFQYIPDITKTLKIIHDSEYDIRIVASGSSALEIRKKISKPLTGRKRIFHCYPLDFNEFLEFKGETSLKTLLAELRYSDFIGPYVDKLSSLYEEFLFYGGFPKVVLSSPLSEKREELHELYSSYIGKDIHNFIGDDDIIRFNRLVSVLASANGGMCNIHRLGNTCDLYRAKVEKYLFLLEQAFVIRLLQPFYTNKQKEIVKTPKVYFNDQGIVNIILQNFNPVQMRRDGGALVETALYWDLIKNSTASEKLNYWRSKNGTEIDFILHRNRELIPIEVKYQKFSRPVIPKNVKSFISTYDSDKAFIITKDFLAVTETDKCEVIFIPAFMAYRLWRKK